eukprot:TRINITY_DN53970_c0_g1_i1.p1 TRINITY_DN53970_c0_g1~~TRINITY_DN53970_c0_g1_i1.p1  ORF type:complete len:270 (+),score=27.79 TRINITY_DN53970_c0_g1_i1:44-853(+)
MVERTFSRCASKIACAVSGVLAVTFATCYGLWLSEDCSMFLPFISDLGLHGPMKVIFIVGLEIATLCFCATLPSIYVARRTLLIDSKQSSAWHAFNVLVMGCAGVVICGIAALGFFPWDQKLWPHLVCASLIFDGGFVWILGSAILSRRLRHCNFWGVRPRLRAMQLALVLISCIVLLASFVFAVLADANNPTMFTAEKLPSMVYVARSDFASYCAGRRGWHTDPWVNWIAVSEWLYVGCLICSVLASCADIESCAALLAARCEPLLLV